VRALVEVDGVLAGDHVLEGGAGLAGLQSQQRVSGCSRRVVRIGDELGTAMGGRKEGDARDAFNADNDRSMEERGGRPNGRLSCWDSIHTSFQNLVSSCLPRPSSAIHS
jgi:hypothetical protein